MIEQGGCHCGNVRFEAHMTVEKVMSCNCSICTKQGTLLDFIPDQDFKLLSGEAFLKEYLFNKKVIRHYFCNHCGVLPFSTSKMPDGSQMRAINVRCLDSFDLEKVKIEFFDGKNMH